jgi:hypothetical protein
MGIKKTFFGDQSSSGRMHRRQTRTLVAVQNSYTNGYYVKNNTDKTTIDLAVARVRANGCIAPAKNAPSFVMPFSN